MSATFCTRPFTDDRQHAQVFAIIQHAGEVAAIRM